MKVHLINGTPDGLTRRAASFVGTHGVKADVRAVEAAALALGCPVEWHPGFRLTVDELRRHPGCRGQEYVDLGARIAVDGVLDPRVVGDAARSGRFDAQAVKKVWHCLARYGVSSDPCAPRTALR